MVGSQRGRSNEVFTFIPFIREWTGQVLSPGMWGAKPGIQIHETSDPRSQIHPIPDLRSSDPQMGKDTQEGDSDVVDPEGAGRECTCIKCM